MYSKIVNTLLAFCILFGFPLPIIHNSTVLAALLILILRHKRLFRIKELLKQKFVKKIYFYILLIIFLSIFVPLYNQNLEFSIVRSLVNQIFIFSTVVLFYATLNRNVSLNQSHWFLINAYVLQSVIILLAYNFSVVEDFVRSFQPEAITEVGEEGYNGFRALSLSAGSFFWVSSAYTMVILICSYKILQKSSNFWSGIAFFILITGSLFTGRTVFVGLLFAIALFLMNSNIRTIIKPIIFTTIISFLMLAVLPSTFFDSEFALWAFELFNTFNDTGKVESSSTNTLLEGFFVPSLKTFLFGDGLWLAHNANGSPYYGGTDAGYIRVILFYGIVGFMVYFLFARFIVFGFSKTLQLNNKLGITFMYLFMFLILVLNIKGQSMSYTTSTQAILFMFFIPYVLKNMNNNKLVS